MLLAALAVMGCEDQGLSPAEAAELVDPHLSHFETFDRWARRAVQADPAFRSAESLEETVFAPVRREDPVLEWVNLRDDALGVLEVTTTKVPDPRARFREGEGIRAVLVRRERPGSDGARVSVTVAYRLADDG